jgi:hypothetical protein
MEEASAVGHRRTPAGLAVSVSASVAKQNAAQGENRGGEAVIRGKRRKPSARRRGEEARRPGKDVRHKKNRTWNGFEQSERRPMGNVWRARREAREAREVAAGPARR